MMMMLDNSVYKYTSGNGKQKHRTSYSRQEPSLLYLIVLMSSRIVYLFLFVKVISRSMDSQVEPVVTLLCILLFFSLNAIERDGICRQKSRSKKNKYSLRK